jgi:hypothetical protein
MLFWPKCRFGPLFKKLLRENEKYDFALNFGKVGKRVDKYFALI